MGYSPGQARRLAHPGHEGSEIIKGKWILKTNLKYLGEYLVTVDKLKSRYCARGDTQH